MLIYSFLDVLPPGSLNLTSVDADNIPNIAPENLLDEVNQETDTNNDNIDDPLDQLYEETMIDRNHAVEFAPGNYSKIFRIFLINQSLKQ